MPNRRAVCPVCQARPNRMRLSPAGSQYGCGRCGKWFGPADAEAVAPPASGELPAASVPNGLAKSSFVLDLKSRDLSQAIDELVPKALHGTKVFLHRERVARDLRENLPFGAVEFRPGLAFLHLRVGELAEMRAALGVSRDGFEGGSTGEEKIFVVVLFLKPARAPGFDIPLWAKRKLCNERTIYKMRTAPDVEGLLEILQST